MHKGHAEVRPDGRAHLSVDARPVNASNSCQCADENDHLMCAGQHAGHAQVHVRV